MICFESDFSEVDFNVDLLFKIMGSKLIFLFDFGENLSVRSLGLVFSCLDDFFILVFEFLIVLDFGRDFDLFLVFFETDLSSTH